MIKFILKIALAMLIANATWRIGSAYVSHYKLKDAAREAALTPRATDGQIAERIMELAAMYGAPLEEENLSVRRDTRNVFIDASYVLPIEVVPGYRYPWRFAWSMEVFVLPGSLAPDRPQGSRAP